MRLIDADTIPWESFPNDFGEYHEDCVEKRVVDKMPTVDAVEVVRCKDCIRWMKDVAGCTDFVGRCAYANYMIGATGYCLYGERKEKGE